MAKMTAWAHFHECGEPEDLAALAGAFSEASEAARAAGCEVSFVGEDAGDREVEAEGPPAAVARAAVEFQERGFDPQVEVLNDRERAAIRGLLPGDLLVHLEPSGTFGGRPPKRGERKEESAGRRGSSV